MEGVVAVCDVEVVDTFSDECPQKRMKALVRNFKPSGAAEWVDSDLP